MEIIKDLESVSLPACVATIGFFDGVHRGHRFLIDQVKKEAADRGLHSLLVSFDRHPRAVMQAAYNPQLLSSLEEKCSLLAATEVSYCALLHFTREMAALSAFDFMQQILRDRLQVRVLLIGYDHHFGHGGKDTFDDYVRYGKQLGIEVIPVPPLEAGMAHISSSVIRRALMQGDVACATEGLQRYFSLTGHVVDGFHVGTALGFPTANIRPECPEQLIPKTGVYAVWTDVSGKRYPGMLNIGVRPTLNNGPCQTIEVHLIGFSGNLYGQRLTLEFVAFIRDEIRFPDKEHLVIQLQRDKQKVMELLQKN